MGRGEGRAFKHQTEPCDPFSLCVPVGSPGAPELRGYGAPNGMSFQLEERVGIPGPETPHFNPQDLLWGTLKTGNQKYQRNRGGIVHFLPLNPFWRRHH